MALPANPAWQNDHSIDAMKYASEMQQDDAAGALKRLCDAVQKMAPQSEIERLKGIYTKIVEAETVNYPLKRRIKMNDTMNIPMAGRPSALQMIEMRLRFNGTHAAVKHIDAYLDDKIAVVFVINKESKPVMLEDDKDLFPSDNLITQLRVLLA